MKFLKILIRSLHAASTACKQHVVTCTHLRRQNVHKMHLLQSLFQDISSENSPQLAAKLIQEGLGVRKIQGCHKRKKPAAHKPCPPKPNLADPPILQLDFRMHGVSELAQSGRSIFLNRTVRSEDPPQRADSDTDEVHPQSFVGSLCLVDVDD